MAFGLCGVLVANMPTFFPPNASCVIRYKILKDTSAFKISSK